MKYRRHAHPPAVRLKPFLVARQEGMLGHREQHAARLRMGAVLIPADVVLHGFPVLEAAGAVDEVAVGLHAGRVKPVLQTPGRRVVVSGKIGRADGLAASSARYP